MSVAEGQVASHIAALPEKRLADAVALDAIFRDVTGWQPRLWGKIIGYGRYRYRYKSGREGEWFATGFSPLAAKISIHIMPGYSCFPDIADRLGPHTRGKACWYVRRLGDVDEAALRDLIRVGLKDLAAEWPVEAS